jgi:hypothetical protein
MELVNGNCQDILKYRDQQSRTFGKDFSSMEQLKTGKELEDQLN